MNTWKNALRRSVATAALTAAATTAAAAVCGWRENRNPVAPLNAISHIAWGEEAATQEEFSAKYTGTGVALNAAAMWSWALLFEKGFGGSNADEQRDAVSRSLLGGTVVSALAYVVDYHLVPKRLTPGLEDRLSSRSLLLIYIGLALSLAAGGLLSRPAE
jgi:hypothetical protein